MKCPGQDMMYWKPGDVFETDCPRCGRPVEFFKDDTARRCGHCDHRFANPRMDFGCAAYCPYADQCIGNLPPEVAAQQENLLKDRVALAAKRLFGRDFARIGRAVRVARHAERLGREASGNLAVILTAAHLLESGHPAAAARYGAAAGDHLGEASTAAAREILSALKAREEMAAAVVAIIRTRYGLAADDSLEYRVVHDATLLADLEERRRNGSPAPPEDHGAAFLTDAGRRQAGEINDPH
jgi:hypothetical protein